MTDMQKTKRLTLCALLIALALALSYVERLIPLHLLIPLPGIKLGLAKRIAAAMGANYYTLQRLTKESLIHIVRNLDA